MAEHGEPADAERVRDRGPLCRGRIAAAERDVHEMLAILTGTLPVTARGAAMASVLLSDGTGPTRVGTAIATVAWSVTLPHIASDATLLSRHGKDAGPVQGVSAACCG